MKEMSDKQREDYADKLADLIFGGAALAFILKPGDKEEFIELCSDAWDMIREEKEAVEKREGKKITGFNWRPRGRIGRWEV